jgi:hypothetical protein
VSTLCPLSEGKWAAVGQEARDDRFLIFWQQLAMPLSAEEMVTAKTAYSEMRSCENTRTLLVFSSCLYRFIIFVFGIFVAFGMPVDDHGRFLRGWSAFLSFLSFTGSSFFAFILYLSWDSCLLIDDFDPDMPKILRW